VGLKVTPGGLFDLGRGEHDQWLLELARSHPLAGEPGDDGKLWLSASEVYWFACMRFDRMRALGNRNLKSTLRNWWLRANRRELAEAIERGQRGDFDRYMGGLWP
jgi:hypothetical protein